MPLPHDTDLRVDVQMCASALCAAAPRPSLVLTSLALLFATFAPLTSSSGSTTFLPALPLKILVTTPVELINAGAQENITLSGRQALQVPFALSCNIPGRFRWVTTAIARLDPDQDWPTDLDCSLTWNTNLTTYDGATLNLTGIPMQRRLVTPTLSMSISSVTSAQADNLTGGLWSAFVGAPDDKLPEVPPDGVVTLVFSAPVNLAMLASSLLLVSSNGTSIPMNISSCHSSALHWLDTGAAAAAQAKDIWMHSNYTDTCAQVQPLQPLGVNSRYNQLYLPVGSLYHPRSGPLKADLVVPVYGLRRFRIPLRQDFVLKLDTSASIYNGPRYRRFDLWLPHGLSTNTSLSHLAAHIDLCQVQDPSKKSAASSCTPLNFSLTLPKPGLARLTAPDLQPHRLYRLSAGAAQAIHDGFGLPLEPSNQSFWTVDSSGYFATPTLASTPVALFETGGTEPVVWPILTSGPSEGNAASVPLTVTSAASWPMQLSDEASVTKLIRLVSAGGSMYVPDVLGTPATHAEIPRNLSVGPQLLQLSLDPALASVHVVHTCCSYQPWLAPPGKISASVTIVTISSLAAAFVTGPSTVTVWVTNTTEAGAGPVAGALAWVYFNLFNAAPQAAGNCTTDSNGACSIHMGNQSGSLMGVALSQGQAVVVANAGYFSPSSPATYLGTLVADRLLVRPGETLHLTGYVQQQAADTTLSLPANGTNVTLQISKGWDPVHTDRTVFVPAVLAADSGSIHAALDVPASGVVGTFTISLLAGVTPSRARLLHEADFDPLMPDAAPASAVLPASLLAASDADAVSSIPVTSDATSSGSSAPARLLLSPVASITITVADPRPPTAELTLTLPAWSRPNASVPVSVSAQSLIGTSVSAANISLVWSTSRASGLSSVVTDASGNGVTSIDLAVLPRANGSTPGDTLRVTAQWVGPTRELLVQRGSVLLWDSPRTVSLSLHPQTNTPGVLFGVSARVASIEDGNDILNVPLNVSLSAASAPECSATGGLGAGAGAPTTCTLLSGAADPAACQLALPCTGIFDLTACTADKEEKACATVQLGLNHSSWAAAPLAAAEPLAIAIVNASSSFSLGDTVGISVQVPRNASSLLFVWGNAKALQSLAIPRLAAGPVTVPLTLGPECLGGCGLAAVLSAPRASPATPAAAGPPVPTSLLYDPLRPLAGSATLHIAVRPSPSLAVSLAVGADQLSDGSGLVSVLPGSNTSIQVSVEYGGQPAAGVEVTIFAVDKAVLDLLPYPLQQLSAAMAQQLAASLHSVDVEALRIGPPGVRAAFAAALRRCLLDPWLSPDVQCQPQPWATAAVDIPDDQYLAGFTTSMTYIPYTFQPCLHCLDTLESISFSNSGGAGSTSKVGSAPVPSAASDQAPTASSAPRLQSQFLTTPLYSVLRSSGQGTVNVTFTAPPNLGTFVVRAYASLWSQGTPGPGGATQDARGLYGSAETQLLVRRPLSLVSSLPAFVRVGDVFSAGVVVTATGLGPTDPQMNATVTLSLGGGSALQLLGSSQQAVVLSAASPQQEVQFQVGASALGTAALTFAAASAGGADSLQLSLEVQGQQAAVVVATSFPVQGTDGAAGASGPAWQEGLQLPDAVKGSGALELVAGVGYLPAILSTYTSLISSYAQLPYPDGFTAFALSTVSLTTSLYNQSLTPDQAAAQAQALSDLMGPLNDDALLGLLDSPLAANAYGKPAQADIVLNAWASWLAASWPQGQQLQRGAPGALSWAAVHVKATTWGAVAAQQLLTNAAQARIAQPEVPYDDLLAVAWVRLALGANWSPAECKATYSTGLCAASAEVVRDVSLERLEAGAAAAGLTTQLLTALALQQAGSSSPLPSATVDLVLSSLRVAGRTAYVSAAPGGAGAAEQSAQALALLLLLTVPSRSPLLTQKLAAYVAQGSRPTPLFPGLCARISPMAATLAIRALANYDEAVGSTTPSLHLEAAVANLTLLQATFSSSTAGAPVNSSTPWDALPPAPSNTTSTLLFYANGTGQASIAAMMTFVPKALMTFPTYRGLWVQSSIQLLDPLSGSPIGPSLQTIPLASIVMVTLQVTSPDDLGAVTVEARMPGGLQPLDPNLASSGALAATGSSCLLYSSLLTKVFWWWWWPPCPTQQTLPSVVTFRYTRLMAGTWTSQFLAVATTPGVFALPPVTAFADQQPELMGMTAAGTIHVCTPEAGGNCTALAAAATAALPAACPDDCSGNGACRLDSGQCLCNQGFTGANCSVVIIS